MSEDIYKEWAKRSTRAWVERFVTMAVSKRCDGTFRSMEDATFVPSANPKELIDELTNGIMGLMWGSDAK